MPSIKQHGERTHQCVQCNRSDFSSNRPNDPTAVDLGNSKPKKADSSTPVDMRPALLAGVATLLAAMVGAMAQIGAANINAGRENQATQTAGPSPNEAPWSNLQRANTVVLMHPHVSFQIIEIHHIGFNPSDAVDMVSKQPNVPQSLVGQNYAMSPPGFEQLIIIEGVQSHKSSSRNFAIQLPIGGLQQENCTVSLINFQAWTAIPRSELYVGMSCRLGK